MEMPEIRQCEAEDCAYNRDRRCHALAITVGDEGCPCCDTYCEEADEAGDPRATGRVGACHSANCAYNSKLECSAPAIAIGMEHQHPDCATFSERR